MNPAQRIFFGIVVIVAMIAIGMCWALNARAADRHHPVPPVEKPICTGLDEIQKAVADRVSIAVFSSIDGDALTGFLDRYNADPPVSDLSGVSALVISSPASDQRIIFLFNEQNCMKFRMLISNDDYNRLMGKGSL